MTDGVTLGAGNNTSPPDSTEFQTKDGGTVGHLPLVGIGYSDGSGSLVTSDASGVLIQGTATLTGIGAATPANGTVADTASSTTIIASNADRKGWRIRNTSSAVLYISFGGTASATNNVEALAQAEGTGDAGIGVYTGAINGVWASDPGDGVAIWTEWD